MTPRRPDPPGADAADSTRPAHQRTMTLLPAPPDSASTPAASPRLSRRALLLLAFLALLAVVVPPATARAAQPHRHPAPPRSLRHRDGLAPRNPQGGIRAPATVFEGGVLTLDVQSGAAFVEIYAPGAGPARRVPVIDGIAEFVLPPTVRGGSVIHVSDLKEPRSATAEIEVLGND